MLIQGGIKTVPLATVSQNVPNISQGRVATRLRCGGKAHIYCRVAGWKKFEYWSAFSKVMEESTESPLCLKSHQFPGFFATSCIQLWSLVSQQYQNAPKETSGNCGGGIFTPDTQPVV